MNRVIKVAIIYDDVLIKKKKNKYYGIIYDLWESLRNDMKIKYNYKFIEYEVNYKNINNINILKNYDIIIGSNIKNLNNTKYFLYSYPLVFDKFILIHKGESMLYKTIVYLLKYIGKYIFYIILFGIFIGVLLAFIEPERSNRVDKEQNLYMTWLLRPIVTTIGAFFGEMGYLIENTSLKIHSIIFTFFVVILGFIIVLILQGLVTNEIINVANEFEADDIDKNDVIYASNFIPNPDYITFVENNMIKYDKNKNTEQLIKYYLNNKTKYKGLLTTTLEFNNIDKKILHADTVISDKKTDYIIYYLMISKKKTLFLHQLNELILKQKQNGKFNRICRSYTSNDNYCSIK